MISKLLLKLKKKSILFLILTFLVFFIAYKIFFSTNSLPYSSNDFEQVAYVELGPLKKGAMNEKGFYHGSLVSKEKILFSSRVQGIVKKINVDIGDKINKGQLLLKIDDEELVLIKKQAENNLSLAKAQYEEAISDYNLSLNTLNRHYNLNQKNIVSKSDLENYQNQLKKSEVKKDVVLRQLKNAENQLDEALLKLSYTEIKGDWQQENSKYISERLVDEGNLVNPNQNLLEAVDLNNLLLVIEVVEKDYPKIYVGQKAKVKVEGWPEELFEAIVERIAPVLNNDNRMAKVELTIKNKDMRLKPGMYAELILIFRTLENIISVPEDVPIRRDGKVVIFLADPLTETVKMVPVTLGIVEDGYVELKNFEDSDYQVVYTGQHFLSDGQKYKSTKLNDEVE